ncbi:MAG: hypothetical protein EOO33_01470 [Comamonadaceae bacterium]|nr:MAG: hypothetical protein EOO33_01470 [Comamonadaceae bacterium]
MNGNDLNTSVRKSVKDLIDYDDSRASAPYEHGIAALAGVGLIAGALLSRSRFGAVLQGVLGGAMLMRAASGQDGLSKWAHASDGAEPSPLIIAR